jgi:DNA-binding LacI/PurR family transcriptional regulator/DNA-binding transcriptional regulator YhcF (GntR family)
LVGFWIGFMEMTAAAKSGHLDSLDESVRASARSGREAGPRARVVRYIQDMIRGGEVLPGQPLPSERVLAQKLGVDRSTVNAAFSMLLEEGAIRSNGGRLRIVNAVNSVESSDGSSFSEWMQDAVVILTPDALPVKWHQSRGWREFITQGALQAVQGNGHAILLNSEKVESAQLQRLLRSNPRGVLVLEPVHSQAWLRELLEVLREKRVPTVFYGDVPGAEEFDRVASDHEAGAYELTRWLISRGRRRILTTSPGIIAELWFRERCRGYERAMREAGLEPQPTLVLPEQPLPPLHEEDEAAWKSYFESVVRHYVGYLVEHLLSPQPPDALLAASDGLTFYLAAACRMLGREPNRDIWIAGYDNYWADTSERALETTPPCATVDKRNELLGIEAARLLQQRIANQLPSGPQHHLVKPELMITAPT